MCVLRKSSIGIPQTSDIPLLVLTYPVVSSRHLKSGYNTTATDAVSIMSVPREGEVLRVPGSPQRDALRVRGSWRDYLDPGSSTTPPPQPPTLSEEEDDDDDACCIVSAEADFEPFSDTCGEGDESDLEGLDLTLFEPASAANGIGPCCSQCCGHCAREVARRNGALPGTLYILTPVHGADSGKHPHQFS